MRERISALNSGEEAAIRVQEIGSHKKYPNGGSKGGCLRRPGIITEGHEAKPDV